MSMSEMSGSKVKISEFGNGGEDKKDMYAVLLRTEKSCFGPNTSEKKRTAGTRQGRAKSVRIVENRFLSPIASE